MNSLPSLTSVQLGNLNSFHQSSTLGVTKKLNLSDPKDLEFIKIMLASAGRLPENYPNLYAVLEQRTADTSNRYSDQVRLTDVGKTSKGKATATVRSQIDGKPLLSGGVLMVLDSDTGDLLAHGANTSVKSAFLDCLTRSATAAQARKNLYTLYLGHTTDTEGVSRFYSSTALATVAEETGIHDKNLSVEGAVMGRHHSDQILCGDQQIICHNILTTRINLEFILPGIQPQLRQDYQSAVAEIRN